VIVAEPAVTPVTTPVVVIEATPALELVHTPPEVVEVSVVVLPTQTEDVPVIGVMAGSGLTVKVTAAALIGQPPTVEVPVPPMIAVPT
jgi:hypothetical protein